MSAAVDLVIPNLDGEALLGACLDGVAAQTLAPARVIVVDSGSLDGSRAIAEAHGAEWHPLPANNGFAAAVNHGIAISDSPYVALLNNDAVPEPGWLAALVEALERDSRHSPSRLRACCSRASAESTPQATASTSAAAAATTAASASRTGRASTSRASSSGPAPARRSTGAACSTTSGCSTSSSSCRGRTSTSTCAPRWRDTRPAFARQRRPRYCGGRAVAGARGARGWQARRLRIGLPRPGLARRDPRALRAALVVALVAAFAIAGDDATSRLAQAMEPTLPREAPPPATDLQAWITPPAYTRLAPIFLKAEGGTASVPVGAHLDRQRDRRHRHADVRWTGGATFRHSTRPVSRPIRILRRRPPHVRRNGHELGRLEPASSPTSRPSRLERHARPRPGSQQTRLPWRVSDDYGVVSLQAELRLRDRRDAPPLVVSLPLPGGSPKSAQGISQQDLTAHPWAGLPVTAKLVGARRAEPDRRKQRSSSCCRSGLSRIPLRAP